MILLTMQKKVIFLFHVSLEFSSGPLPNPCSGCDPTNAWPRPSHFCSAQGAWSRDVNHRIHCCLFLFPPLTQKLEFFEFRAMLHRKILAVRFFAKMLQSETFLRFYKPLCRLQLRFLLLRSCTPSFVTCHIKNALSHSKIISQQSKS